MGPTCLPTNPVTGVFGRLLTAGAASTVVVAVLPEGGNGEPAIIGETRYQVFPTCPGIVAQRHAARLDTVPQRLSRRVAGVFVSILDEASFTIRFAQSAAASFLEALLVGFTRVEAAVHQVFAARCDALIVARVLGQCRGSEDAGRRKGKGGRRESPSVSTFHVFSPFCPGLLDPGQSHRGTNERWPIPRVGICPTDNIYVE